MTNGTWATPRQLECLYYRQFGSSNKQVARKMGVSIKRIDALVSCVSMKVGARDGCLDSWLVRGEELAPCALKESA